MPLELPESTADETVDGLVAASRRLGGFPLRREFLQQADDHDQRIPGPLASLVVTGDRRALLLYLLLVTKASSAPWDARLPAAVWARALGVDLPTTKTAASTISKAWLRLERRQLVRRARSKRLAVVTLLREDGSGREYTSPGEVGDRFFKVPLALWGQGPEPGGRWYRELRLPELAVLLIGLSLADGFRLPVEQGPDWYGVSADTIGRGIAGLAERGLLRTDKLFKKAPLSAVGYTAEHHYTLLSPFGPVGRPSRAARLARQNPTGRRKPSA